MALKNIFILMIIFISAIHFTVNAQTPPSNKLVLQTVNNIRNELSVDDTFGKSAVNDENEEIRGLVGNFSRSDVNQCLALVEMESGPMIGKWVILMEENNKGIWKFSGWYSLWNYEVRLIDIDNDGIKEIILENGYTQMGITESNYKLISIKNNNEVLLYSNNGFDNSGNPYAIKTGEEFSKEVEVEFEDLNNDGLKEIIEKTKIGYLKSYDKRNNEIMKDFKEEKLIYYLKNGIYQTN